MRRLLGVLRRDDDPRALAPQPGLAQLAELAELMHSRGLDVRDRRGRRPAALTPGIDLVAYRVIEAALAGAADQGGWRDAHESRAGAARARAGGHRRWTVPVLSAVTCVPSPSASRSMTGASRSRAEEQQLVVRCSAPARRRWSPDEHRRPDRRRPDAGPDGLPDDPRRRAGPASGGRGKDGEAAVEAARRIARTSC